MITLALLTIRALLKRRVNPCRNLVRVAALRPWSLGYNREHRALEEELAAFMGRSSRAVVLNRLGGESRCSAASALLGKGDTLIADELNHASLIDGGRLSGAQYTRVPHAQLEAYAQALAQPRSGETLVVSDSVFSMDGDLAPLKELAALSAASNATLMIDDAHGLGVIGADGSGAVNDAGLGVNEVPIYVATLGKSLGAAGAFVAGSDNLIEYLDSARAQLGVLDCAAAIPSPLLLARGIEDRAE